MPKTLRLDTWAEVASLAVVILSLEFVALTAQDYALLSGIRAPNHTVLHGIVSYAYWFAIPFVAVASFLASRWGWAGILLLAVSTACTVAIPYNFRSDLIRPGTFDFFEDSTRMWTAPLLVGLALGAAPGLLSIRIRPPTHSMSTAKWQLVGPALVLLCGLEALRETISNPTSSWSAFPPTRHWAYFVFGLGLTILWLVGRCHK